MILILSCFLSFNVPLQRRLLLPSYTERENLRRPIQLLGKVFLTRFKRVSEVGERCAFSCSLNKYRKNSSSLLSQDNAVSTVVNHWQTAFVNKSHAWLKALGGLIGTADFPNGGKRTQKRTQQYATTVAWPAA
jgi:hypothetical protein